MKLYGKNNLLYIQILKLEKKTASTSTPAPTPTPTLTPIQPPPLYTFVSKANKYRVF